MPCTARGGTVVVLPKPDPALLLAAIAKHRVSEFFLPPTVIYRLLETPGVRERDFSSLRYLLYAAASMSTEKLRRALGVFGPVLMEAYGQVEAFSVAYFRPEEHYLDGQIAPDWRLASCGRPYFVRRRIMSRSSAATKISSCCRYRLRRTEYFCPFRKRASIDMQIRPSDPKSKTSTGWPMYGMVQLKKMMSTDFKFAR